MIQHREVFIEGGQNFVGLSTNRDGTKVRLNQPGYTLEVTPEEAWEVGKALQEFARDECGYRPGA